MSRPIVLVAVLAISCARTGLPSQSPGDEQTPGEDTGQNNRPPPIVAIVSPARGDEVAGVITVSGTASSETAEIVSVGLSIDGGAYIVVEGQDAWTFQLDTSALTDGVHTLRARAVDSDRTNGYSSLLGVSSRNGVAPPPPTTDNTVGFTAYFDPELGRTLTREDLQPHGSSFASSSETLTGCLITSPIVMGSADITLRGCLIELQSASPSSTFAISSGTGNVRLEYVTIRTSDQTIMRSLLNNLNGGEPVIDHCDISHVAIGFTDNRNGGIVQNSRITARNVGIAFDDGIVGPVYANNVINIEPDGDSAITVSGSAINLQIIGNVLNGGAQHIRVASNAEVRRMRVLGNFMNGHTTPTYTALNAPASITIVETAAEQNASGGTILWPTSGDDINTWRGTTDLTPSREGVVINPRPVPR